MDTTKDIAREAVGIFADEGSLVAAIDALQLAGFEQSEISVLASEKAVKEKLGGSYKRVEQLENNPKVPRTIFVPTETIGEVEGALMGLPMYLAATTATGLVVATGGTLLAAIMAAAAAGGGGMIFGSLLASLVANHHADYISQQVEKGGLLLWVNIRDANAEKKALEILQANSGHDVHVHDIKVTY